MRQVERISKRAGTNLEMNDNGLPQDIGMLIEMDSEMDSRGKIDNCVAAAMTL